MGDADALAAAVGEALDDPGNPASRRARAAEFSQSAAVGRYLALLERFSGAPPAPATVEAGLTPGG